MPGVILVTRPEPAGSRTVERLAEEGGQGLAAPLFVIERTAEPRPKGRFKALLVTSQNGADGLSPDVAGLPPETPAFAVGDRTADVLRAAGFANVTSASGDQSDLSALALSMLAAPSRILIACGEPRMDGLEAALAAAGHEAALWVRYRSVAHAELPQAAREALAGGAVSGVLHFSRRAAGTFLEQAGRAGLGNEALALAHVCISEQAAGPLREAGAARIAIAPSPDEAGMIRAALAAAGHDAVPPGAEAHGAGSAASAPIPDPLAQAAPPSPAAAPAASPASSPAAGAPAGGTSEPRRRGAGAFGLLVAGLIGGAVGGGVTAFWPDLSARLGLARPADAALEAVRALEARLRRLETAPQPAPQPSPPPAAQPDPATAAAIREAQAGVADLRRATEALDRRVADAAARPAAGSAPAQPPAEILERLDRAEQGAAAARSAVEALSPRLAEVERKAGAAATGGGGAGAAAASLVLAERVERRLVEGRPFADEVRALAALGLSGPALATLEAVAPQGAPAVSAMAAEFRRLRPAMASESAQPAQGWTDRLLRLTDGLIRVTPVGEPQGASPTAALARIERAMQRGDAGAAAASWAELPEPARRVSEGLGRSLQARAQVDQALRSIVDDAVKALSAAR